MYTLSSRAGGRATIRADCNRGTGGWTSDAPGQLRFGALATTRARCPPGSISAVYPARLQRVRDHAFRDGHPFLTTRVDGAIISFAPIEGD